MSGTFRTCAVCRQERQTTGGGRIKKHNRWDAGKGSMVPCEGSLRVPVSVAGRP